MGQAKLKGRTHEDRRLKAIEEGRVKRPRLSAAERDKLLFEAALAASFRLLMSPPTTEPTDDWLQ